MSESGSFVFLLQHTNVLPGGATDVKLLGVYSTEEAAQARAERARELPGFASVADGFRVERHEVGQDRWVEGFVTVQLVMVPLKGGRGYRAVRAVRVEDTLWEMLPTPDSTTEWARFGPGTRVVCELVDVGGTPSLIAMREAE